MKDASVGWETASYRALWESGELAKRRDQAWERLGSCDLCAHACGVDRRQGETGVCRAGDTARVSSFGPHFGEEDVLVGHHGSGTIFFTGCNLRCVFCQNWGISHLRDGAPVSAERLGDMMLELQDRGCHNVNLVTPTHYVPQILSALDLACSKGLQVPLVYNCGGYESLTTLTILQGVVDIYMPDAKFLDSEVGHRLTGTWDYPEVVKAALKEMHNQVGDLVVDADGIALRGLIIRHLVLPGGLAGTGEFVSFVASELSRDSYVNIMPQYYPAYRAKEYPPLDRRITYAEYEQAVELARRAGLHRLA